jgi:inosose dehydratase
MTDFLDRVAGAPITWGVDGSPGWGHLMDADRVMSEMVDAGLRATELGPDGFLPTDPDELIDYIAGFDLAMVGGFVPAVLYRDDDLEGQFAYVDRASQQLSRTGANTMVLGPDSHFAGYDTQIDMDEDQWQLFLRNLAQVQDISGANGVATALHPHWGMAIARGHQVDRLLESSDVGLCVDTGHLFLGGVDPLDVVRAAGDRVIHVHLKDLDDAMAEQVRSGQVPFRQAVIDGMFKPVGSGDVDIAGVIRHLEGNGYRGWYVLEQDCALSADPQPGEGPFADAKNSVEYLRTIADSL